MCLQKCHSIVEHRYICQQIYLSIICIISMSSVELHQIAQRSSGLSWEPWAQAKAEANSGKLAGTTLTRKGSEKWPYLALWVNNFLIEVKDYAHIPVVGVKVICSLACTHACSLMCRSRWLGRAEFGSSNEEGYKKRESMVFHICTCTLPLVIITQHFETNETQMQVASHPKELVWGEGESGHTQFLWFRQLLIRP